MLGRVVVAALLAAGPASATFRGHNGLIAFSRVANDGASVVAVDPSGGPEVTLRLMHSIRRGHPMERASPSRESPSATSISTWQTSTEPTSIR
jgi:hypothetical protein